MSNQTNNILKVLLADTFNLYLKTLNYHWHIKGSDFYEIHLLLEKQYNELAEAVDEIAEVIVSNGEKAPATMKEYLKLTTLEEGDCSKSEEEMLNELSSDHKKISEIIGDLLDKVDYISADLLTSRGRAHSKSAWMLGASTKNK
ncbi:DNA starvation/stationary phase protection protein [Rickettsiales bacterium LUAb2]